MIPNTKLPSISTSQAANSEHISNVSHPEEIALGFRWIDRAAEGLGSTSVMHEPPSLPGARELKRLISFLQFCTQTSGRIFRRQYRTWESEFPIFVVNKALIWLVWSRFTSARRFGHRGARVAGAQLASRPRTAAKMSLWERTGSSQDGRYGPSFHLSPDASAFGNDNHGILAKRTRLTANALIHIRQTGGFTVANFVERGNRSLISACYGEIGFRALKTLISGRREVALIDFTGSLGDREMDMYCDSLPAGVTADDRRP